MCPGHPSRHSSQATRTLQFLHQARHLEVLRYDKSTDLLVRDPTMWFDPKANQIVERESFRRLRENPRRLKYGYEDLLREATIYSACPQFIQLPHEVRLCQVPWGEDPNVLLKGHTLSHLMRRTSMPVEVSCFICLHIALTQ